MKLKNKFSLWLSALLCTLSTQIFAEPYAYDCLYNPATGVRVDLISDYHPSIIDRSNNSENNEFLSEGEHNQFSISSRILLNTLRKLAQNAHDPVSLLCEYNTEHQHILTKSPEIEKNTLALTILIYIAEHVTDNLAQHNLITIPVDCYRNQIYIRNILNKKSNKLFAPIVLKELENFQENTLLHHDLEQLRLCTSQEEYTKIKNLWDEYRETKLNYYHKKLKTIEKQKLSIKEALIQANKVSTQESLMKKLFGHESFQESWMKITQGAISDIMNFELLFKFFIDQSKHKIIYAGGAHINFLRKTLTDTFGFKCLTDAGTNTTEIVHLNNKFNDSYLLTLHPSVWSLLEEPIDNLMQKEPIENNQETYNLQDYLSADTIGDDPEKVQFLINNVKKYDLNLQRFFLFLAAEKGWNNSLKMLLETSSFINSCNNSLQSPLTIAIKHNQVESVKLLLEYGADITQCNIENSTPLMIAVDSNHTEIAQLILQQIPNLNIEINQQNLHGDTALIIACRKKEPNSEIITILLEHGADPNIINNKNASPLFWIANNEALTQLLIKYNATINHKLEKGIPTPVSRAACYNNLASVSILLNAGADPNIEDEKKQTALHWGIKYNCSTEIIHALYTAQANIDAQDIDGNTPLHLAAQRENEKTIDYLLKLGAREDIVNNARKTAYDLYSTWRKFKTKFMG